MLNSDAHYNYLEAEYQAELAMSDAVIDRFRNRIEAEKRDLAELVADLNDAQLLNWAQWAQNAHDALEGFE